MNASIFAEVLKIKLKKIKNIYKFITLNKKWGVKKMKICGKKLIAGAAALAMAIHNPNTFLIFETYLLET